jgi:pimeloyl-ACP methyl ester carboxylesterase
VAAADATTSAATPPKRRGRWWWVWRIARSVLLIYLLLLIVFYALQNWMIFPGRATQGTPAARIAPSKHYELIELRTRSGERIAAVFGAALGDDGKPAPDATARPTILFFYGNGMCMADAMEQFWDLRRLGANVMVPDYAGYGMSSGKPSEQSFYETADACWAHLMSRDDIDKTGIVASGWSIGAAVAIDLAAREPVAGLVLYSAFTSMNDMARGLFPWLPTSVLLKHRFDSERKIRSIDVPILIVHGRGDRIIPFEMSQRLSKAAKGRVTALWVETDHNDLFALGFEGIQPVLSEFLRTLTPRR